MSDEKTAAELVAELKAADEETAVGILNAEQAREESAQRVTVLEAAKARLEALAQPGETLSSTPSGAWAHLLDGDGVPVTREGQPVAAELTP